MTGQLLYAVMGLTLSTQFDETSGFRAPCADTNLNQWSRWIKDSEDTVCDNAADLGAGTIKIYQYTIDARTIFGDLNDDIVDANRDFKVCDVEDQAKTYLGKVRASDGSCWHHVHIAEMDVFDLSGADLALYTVSGNMASIVGGMEIFESDIMNNFAVVGKFGDHVEIDTSLPSPLNDEGVQDAYKTLEYNPSNKPILMCGSPEEVASDPFYGDNGFDVILPENSGWRSMSKWELSGQKHTIWTHFALESEDQLRMKMAWSLSQIVSVGLPADARGTHDMEETEGWLAFYDMFVKNAYGNYRDLMREFSYSVIMANWLSFEDNRSLQYNIDNDGGDTYPDENFAREIMQLFSVGLFKLNMDGTIIYQENGNPEDTYSMDGIQSYARAWTGFVKRPERGGASPERGFQDQTLDPMTINIDTRDWFPKNDLANGFIGDKVARCADLPANHPLRQGATYQLLGAVGTPELQEDPEWWAINPDFLHLEIESTSPLYAKLCEVDTNGDCTLPAKVRLDTTLVYDDTAKTGAEYAVDTIRTVQMKVGSVAIWYEYIRQPCVEHSFYRDAKRVTKGQIKNQFIQESNMCANPVLEAATPMCSNAGWETEEEDGLIYCRYQGERMTYDSAVVICEANGMEQSYPWTVKQWKAGPCQSGISTRDFRSCANSSCDVKVKVEFGSGHIAIVHSPGPDRADLVNIESLVDPDTINFFATPWEGTYPSLSDCLSISSCYVHEEGYCICNTDATETVVYSSAGQVSSIDQLMSELYIGAVDPATFDANTYNDLGSCNIEGVTVHSKTSECASLSSDTIFVFEWNSKPFFLQNSKSMVSISNSGFQFRNPVQFISLSDPEARDAHYETEEVLDSLFYPSHPPFMAVRVIQRFGISNPSPGFVERVATAYKTGSFKQSVSGKYGDLGAMVAAIILDDESRSPVLDADQSHGHLREPLIKVLSFFRSLGLHYETPFNVPTLMGMEENIGQGSFDNPSVFSFFLPEFTPTGVVQSAGLIAPESQVLQGDNILFLLDAYFSTVKFGIAECHSMSSFGGWKHNYPFECPSTEGDSSLSPARLSYWPQSTASVDDIIDELDILLTSGRLQDRNRALIKSIVEPMMGDESKAIRSIETLLLSTPEYHSTNLPRNQDTVRQITGYYKAQGAVQGCSSPNDEGWG
mmetsp:Transcript_598/g.1174  ORF Transcript_598/g.1174 Transcript_598/m.1174 type:complete len:1161 (+) Transcript_598:1495-4977(+)